MAKKIANEKVRRRQARRVRVAKGLSRSDRVALNVFRSNKHIYAQLIDPATGRTLTAVSTRSKAVLGDVASSKSTEAARKVGEAIAGQAREREIEEVVFHRNGFLYHGRVKALAEAAREAGLKF